MGMNLRYAHIFVSALSFEFFIIEFFLPSPDMTANFAFSTGSWLPLLESIPSRHFFFGRKGVGGTSFCPLII